MIYRFAGVLGSDAASAYWLYCLELLFVGSIPMIFRFAMFPIVVERMFPSSVLFLAFLLV